MPSAGGWGRREFVRTIAAVGTVGGIAGCTGGGDGDGDATPTPTPTETETAEPTESGSDGEEGASGDGSIESTVTEVNTIIEQLNRCGPDTDLCLESTNERFQNVDDIEYVENVSASSPEELESEAQRLRDEIERIHNDLRDKVPREINQQAVEQVGFELLDDPDAYESPEDFREGAQDVPNDRAAEAMNQAADGMERIEEALTGAAETLENAAGSA